MQPQLSFITIVNGYNVYNVVEIDTGVFFCSPKHRMNDYWFNEHPEFYLSKVKGKWVSECELEKSFASQWLLQDAIKAIEDYYFKLRFNKKGS
jgi:hypothetical protein